MRISELRGLMKDCVNFDPCVIRAEKRADRFNNMGIPKSRSWALRFNFPLPMSDEAVMVVQATAGATTGVDMTAAPPFKRLWNRAARRPCARAPVMISCSFWVRTPGQCLAATADRGWLSFRQEPVQNRACFVCR